MMATGWRFCYDNLYYRLWAGFKTGTMKTWTDDNPKAGLLKRKREAILAAARRQFLSHGYGGTSMEAVAADAGVSIMTLYRHAESKDDLFKAVIAIACDGDEDKYQRDLSRMPLAETLVATGVAFQEKLTRDDTMALLRAVIAEHDRFPELAGIAFDAAVGHLSAFIAALLHQAPQAAGLSGEARAGLVTRFVDDLLGTDTLRVLLGLSGSDAARQRARAEAATRQLMVQIAGDAIPPVAVETHKESR